MHCLSYLGSETSGRCQKFETLRNRDGLNIPRTWNYQGAHFGAITPRKIWKIMKALRHLYELESISSSHIQKRLLTEFRHIFADKRF